MIEWDVAYKGRGPAGAHTMLRYFVLWAPTQTMLSS